MFSVLASETVPMLGEPGNADVDYLKIWLRKFFKVCTLYDMFHTTE